jgi:hypothetical protein
MAGSSIAVVAGVIITAAIAISIHFRSQKTSDQYGEAPWTSSTGGAWYHTAGLAENAAAYRQLSQQLRSPQTILDNAEEYDFDGLRGLMVNRASGLCCSMTA